MRHSSPESIKSAPVQLKPRSTSHDALSKKKDRHQSQTSGASMDSLAKQALLAAQVLNLIPTQKARERYISIWKIELYIKCSLVPL